jgi:hypothetical protein
MLFRFGWRIAVAQLLWGLVAIRHGAGLPWCAGKLDGIGAFRQFRGAGDDRLQEVLAASEAEIRQHAQDLYWRLYFALT